MSNNTTTQESVEKVAAKLFDDILGDMSGYDEFGYAPYREAAMRKIIAALAEDQSAPVEPSDDTPGEFIAEALRVSGPLRYVAHANTLHKLAEAEKERDRLSGLINDTADHWLQLQHKHPIRWKGAIDGAMKAGCREIEALTAKLAVAREALAFYSLPSCGGFPDNFAYQALAQIGHADD